MEFGISNPETSHERTALSFSDLSLALGPGGGCGNMNPMQFASCPQRFFLGGKLTKSPVLIH